MKLPARYKTFLEFYEDIEKNIPGLLDRAQNVRIQVPRLSDRNPLGVEVEDYEFNVTEFKALCFDELIKLQDERQPTKGDSILIYEALSAFDGMYSQRLDPMRADDIGRLRNTWRDNINKAGYPNRDCRFDLRARYDY